MVVAKDEKLGKGMYALSFLADLIDFFDSMPYDLGLGNLLDVPTAYLMDHAYQLYGRLKKYRKERMEEIKPYYKVAKRTMLIPWDTLTEVFGPVWGSIAGYILEAIPEYTLATYCANNPDSRIARWFLRYGMVKEKIPTKPEKDPKEWFYGIIEAIKRKYEKFKYKEHLYGKATATA